MSKQLFIQAITKYILGVILVALLIFIPAGTTKYINGWILMATLFIPMFFAGIVMMIKSPALLKKRLDFNERRGKQKIIIKLSGLMFIAGFIIAGLNFRFGWYMISTKVVILAVIIFLIGYLIYARVLHENAYLSRSIKVSDNQKIVDSGLYGIVRHPMYSATLLLFLTIPLILGSLYSFIIFLIYPFIICSRIIDEEKMLENDFPEYTQYKKKVKYRLIPFIW